MLPYFSADVLEVAEFFKESTRSAVGLSSVFIMVKSGYPVRVCVFCYWQASLNKSTKSSSSVLRVPLPGTSLRSPHKITGTVVKFY